MDFLRVDFKEWWDEADDGKKAALVVAAVCIGFVAYGIVTSLFFGG